MKAHVHSYLTVSLTRSQSSLKASIDLAGTAEERQSVDKKVKTCRGREGETESASEMSSWMAWLSERLTD